MADFSSEKSLVELNPNLPSRWKGARSRKGSKLKVQDTFQVVKNAKRGAGCLCNFLSKDLPQTPQALLARVNYADIFLFHCFHEFLNIETDFAGDNGKQTWETLFCFF